MTYFIEEVPDGGDCQQRLRIEREVYRDDSDHQHVLIFENKTFGRVLALDNIVQTTTRDQAIYHEMLVHVPMVAHGRARRVLIIGGGDGGALRTALKHNVDSVTMVELDRVVIDLAREHLTEICGDAFDDQRAEVVIADGAKFVAETEQRFDVIAVDSPDPVGPAKVLFSQAFYENCQRCLVPGGVLVTQNGVPFVQADELRDSIRKLRVLFQDVACYVAPVPAYTGGHLAFGWASDDPALRRLPSAVIEDRAASIADGSYYYNAATHQACFALPNYIARLL